MSFENIIGNDENKRILENTVKNKNILHSYLFYGADGIGKKIFAKEFAKMILCNEASTGQACNKCKSCVEFNSGNNPDFSIIESDGTSIKIDQIRQMQKGILEKPIESTKKVYIIDNSHLMTKEAQNCMLKTLEEPQEFVVIILIASNENNILPTVKSRCTKIFFKELNDAGVTRYMLENYKDESVDKSIIRLCSGSISKADFVIRKMNVLNQVKDFIQNIEEYNELQFIQNNQLFNDNKDDINILLDYINILLFEKIRYGTTKVNGYINSIKVVEKTKAKLANSNNYDMTIDNMLIRMWEEVHEKNCRS